MWMPRALGQDEALHLRVPTTGLVSEVDAAVEQLANGDDGHGRTPFLAGATWPRGSQLCRRGRLARSLVPGRASARRRSGGTEGCERRCHRSRSCRMRHAKSPAGAGAASSVSGGGSSPDARRFPALLRPAGGRRRRRRAVRLQGDRVRPPPLPLRRLRRRSARCGAVGVAGCRRRTRSRGRSSRRRRRMRPGIAGSTSGRRSEPRCGRPRMASSTSRVSSPTGRCSRSRRLTAC